MRAALLLALAAAPAAAQEARTFQPPAGCEAWLTVQSASCTVSHHFTCAADPEGWRRSVTMDEGGITQAATIDAETQWIETLSFLAGTRERLAPGSPDPASLSALLATGRDDYDFTTLSDEAGPTRFTGFDRLTGETVTIDGVTLERTEFAILARDGEGREVWRARGNQYVSRGWGRFFGGPAEVAAGGEAEAIDDSPVEFVLPGEPGFLSVSPKHGCGAVMSALGEGPSHG